MQWGQADYANMARAMFSHASMHKQTSVIEGRILPPWQQDIVQTQYTKAHSQMGVYLGCGGELRGCKWSPTPGICKNPI